MQTLKGGARISLRFVAFSGIIIGSSALIQAYRNKSNPLDFMAGGSMLFWTIIDKQYYTPGSKFGVF